MSTSLNQPQPIGPSRHPEFGTAAAATPVGTPISHGTAGDGKRGTFPEISGLIVAASQHLLLVAVLAVGLAAGLAYATTQFVSEEYLATSFVKVRQREDFLLFNEQSRAEDAAVVRSQKELVLRHQTLTEALKNESVQQISDSLPEGSRVDWLRSKLKIDMQSGAEVLAITASHESAEVAQILVNAVTEAYLEDVAERAAAERERRKSELQRTAEIINGRLSKKWGQLETLAGSLGTGSLQTLGLREQIQMQGYREYAQQLRAAQLHRNQLETQLAEEKLRQQAPPSISEAELYSAIQRHPEVVSQRSRIDFLNNKIREIKEIVSDENSPRIQALIDDRNFYQEQLQALLADLQPKMREQMQQQQLAQRSHMKDELTTQIALKRDEEKFLSQMLSDMEGDLETDSGGSGVQLEMLRHEIDRQEELADSIWHSLEKLKIEEQARPRVSLIELASLPDQANRGRQLKAAAVAACAGVFIAVFGVGYIEWRMCRVRNPRDVSQLAGLSVFGTGSYSDGLPLLWRMRNAKSDPLNSGVNEVAAQLMLHTTQGNKLPSVLVTSATAQEPRHVVAAELAQALARTGRKTLLVDADPVRNDLSRSFRATKQGGLADWTPEKNSFASSIIATGESDLDFLPAGKTSRSSMLMVARALPILIEQVATKYDAIVVCGPAVLTSAETVLVASHIDFSVFTFAMGKSRWNLLAAARERLQVAQVPVIGAVFHVARRIKPIKQRKKTSDVANEPQATVHETQSSTTDAPPSNLHGDATRDRVPSNSDASPPTGQDIETRKPQVTEPRPIAGGELPVVDALEQEQTPAAPLSESRSPLPSEATGPQANDAEGPDEEQLFEDRLQRAIREINDELHSAGSDEAKQSSDGKPTNDETQSSSKTSRKSDPA